MTNILIGMVSLVASLALNIFSFLTLAFVVGSFYTLVHLGVRDDFKKRVRGLALQFSIALLVLSAVFEVIFIVASPWYAFESDPVWNGSIWLCLASNVLGALLIYASNAEEAGRHSESTVFDLAVYAMCGASTSYVVYCTCYFGDALQPAYFAADMVSDILTLSYAFLIWRYVRVVMDERDRPMQIVSQILLLLTIASTALFLTCPWTELFITRTVPGQMGTGMPTAFVFGFAPTVLVGAGVLVVTLRSGLATNAKISFVLLVICVPISTAIRILIPHFYFLVIVNLIALTFCHFGISSRRALDYRRHQGQVDMASAIQQGMLPQEFPDDSRFKVAARMWPAKEVAGDFYDFYQVDEDHLYITIADVSGKDVPAAMFMARAHALIREFESQDLPPHEILNRVNAALAEGNSQKLFVTAWMGKINLRIGLLTYANAGHNPPILVTNDDDEIRFLRTKVNLILGIRKNTKYKRQTLLLHKGDRIMLYTDGVTESINTAEEQYGEERLLAFTKTTLNLTGKEAVEGVFDDVKKFATGMEQFDDVTVLCASYHSDPVECALDFAEAFFPADTSALYDVISFVDENCRNMGYPELAIPKLEVCAEEVFADIAHFAYGSETSDGDWVRVSVARTKTEINIQFSDKGSPFNPLFTLGSTFLDRARSGDKSRLGIILVNLLMDDVRYEFTDGENRLTIAKKIPESVVEGGEQR